MCYHTAKCPSIPGAIKLSERLTALVLILTRWFVGELHWREDRIPMASNKEWRLLPRLSTSSSAEQMGHDLKLISSFLLSSHWEVVTPVTHSFSSSFFLLHNCCHEPWAYYYQPIYMLPWALDLKQAHIHITLSAWSTTSPYTCYLGRLIYKPASSPALTDHFLKYFFYYTWCNNLYKVQKILSGSKRNY